MDLGIAGKSALVCASSKGIGRACAEALALEGVNLFLCSRQEDEIEKAAKEIRSKSAVSVHHLACDLNDQQSRETLIENVKKVYGNPDIVIHNTGGPKHSLAESTPLEEWGDGFHRLFASVAHLNSAFLPGMKNNKWGRVIAITSLSVVEPIANLSVSNAMRSAVTSMLKTLADEVAPFGITVNCLAPGMIYTERTEERISSQIEQKGGDREQHIAQSLKAIPAARFGKTEEMGSAAAFLCSQQAAYITGSTICVDGGKRRSTY